jgi:hypothetical protein
MSGGDPDSLAGEVSGGYRVWILFRGEGNELDQALPCVQEFSGGFRGGLANVLRFMGTDVARRRVQERAFDMETQDASPGDRILVPQFDQVSEFGAEGIDSVRDEGGEDSTESICIQGLAAMVEFLRREVGGAEVCPGVTVDLEVNRFQRDSHGMAQIRATSFSSRLANSTHTTRASPVSSTSLPAWMAALMCGSMESQPL